MEISPDKTKVMTNNPSGFQREIKIKGQRLQEVMTNNPNGFQREIKIRSQRLEEVENFKYLGVIISYEGSQPEILFRIAQTTAALSRLKII